ncbi:transglutaminase domain-containing protein [Candidatus Woesearchaeota archaeon]|nr:transglutaminase domain-containing protein [Candidatus Woesearchaeota archaeon]
MKKLFVLVIFILLLVTVWAEDDAVLYVNDVVMELRLYSTINLVKTSSRSRVDYVSAKLAFLPIDDYRQEVISLESVPGVREDDSVIFTWDEPAETKLDYYLLSKIRTYDDFLPVTEKIRFPLLSIEEEEYLEETELIDINKEIIELGSSLAEGEDDLFVVVFKLAEWVNRNIIYDDSLSAVTAEATQKSTWVLEHKEGVCDELTNLFISLCRSMGIPARFVSGIAYTNIETFQNSWGLHGWAEVYFPGHGWVPFDVTYGQLGYVDAGHIKLKHSIDSQKASTTFEWKSIDTELNAQSLGTEVSISEYGKAASELFDVTLDVLSDRIDIGSYNLIEVTLTNKKDYYVTTELILSKPKEIVVKDQRKFVLLKPGEKKMVFWIAEVDSDLRENYIYTFPFSIRTSSNKEHESEFKAENNAIKFTYTHILGLLSEYEEDKVYRGDVTLDCAHQEKADVNKSFSVNCSVRNVGNVILNNLRICLDSDCKTIDLGISQAEAVTFGLSYGELGQKALTATAKNKDVSKAEFLTITVIDRPLIEVTDLIYPDKVTYRDNFDIVFELWKRSFSEPQNIKVVFVVNGEEETAELDELSSYKPFKYTLSGDLLKLMDNRFSILIHYEDEEGRAYLTEEHFSIDLNEPTFWEKIQIWLNQAGKWLEGLLK